MKKFCTILIFVLVSSFNVLVQAGENSSVKAIVGATLVDINGKQNIENAVVIVTGEKISAVGNSDEINVPANAEIIDATGRWLVPGLMNMHVHLGLVLPGKLEAELANETEGELTLRMADNARQVLRAGITTIRLPSDQRHGDLALKKAIAKGQAIGPRIFSAGEPLAITGGHGSEKGKTFYDGPYELMKAARKEISAGASWVKILISGGISTNGGDISVALMTPEEIVAVVDVAHRFGAKVAAHSGSSAATNVAIDAGVDSIEHGYFLNRKVLKKMKKYGTWLVPTILVSQPALVPFFEEIGAPEWYMKRRESVGKEHWKALQMAIEEKVNIALGTDQLPSAPTDGTTATVREAEYYVEAGMTPLQALRAATIEPARMLGADNNSGSLEVGKYADILIVENNPAEDIKALRNIQLVMKGGVVYTDKLSQ
jgi:imidazolonepropionase-like amidohydrolase